MINKFKNNFLSLNGILTPSELIDFLIEKIAFNEKFMKIINESNELTKLTNVRENKTKNYNEKEYNLDISKIDNNYVVGYDIKKNKITVDISGNAVFSYYDTKQELEKKLSTFIINEEYENANILYSFMKKCEN